MTCAPPALVPIATQRVSVLIFTPTVTIFILISTQARLFFNLLYITSLKQIPSYLNGLKFCSEPYCTTFSDSRLYDCTGDDNKAGWDAANNGHCSK